MAFLRIVGALDRCQTLPQSLDTTLIARMRYEDETVRSFALEALEELRSKPPLGDCVAG